MSPTTSPSQQRPRASSDSRTHLLASSRPPSIAPSISSVISSSSTLAPETHTLRGFSSREAYLAALNDFAESKMYMEQSDHTLHGFYGVKTMDEYKGPSLREERQRRKEAERRQIEREGRRRATLATILEPARTGDSGSLRSGDGEVAKTDLEQVKSAPVHEESTENAKEGKMRRLSRVFSGGRRYSAV